MLSSFVCLQKWRCHKFHHQVCEGLWVCADCLHCKWLHMCQSSKTGCSAFRYCLFPLYLLGIKGEGRILLHFHFAWQTLRRRLLNSLSFIRKICFLWAPRPTPQLLPIHMPDLRSYSYVPIWWETTLELMCSNWPKAYFLVVVGTIRNYTKNYHTSDPMLSFSISLCSLVISISRSSSII